MKVGMVSEIKKNKDKFQFILVESYENEQIKIIVPHILTDDNIALGDLIALDYNEKNNIITANTLNKERLTSQQIKCLSNLILAKKKKLEKYKEMFNVKNNFYSQSDKNTIKELNNLIRIEKIVIDNLYDVYQNAVNGLDENVFKKDPKLYEKSLEKRITNFIKLSSENVVNVRTWLEFYNIYQEQKANLNIDLIENLESSLLNSQVNGCENIQQAEIFGLAYSKLVTKLNEPKLKL